ncbi:MAG: D-TA family PLP-dependent enzyme [Planctomycetota bacterium]|nr:D-TA family PLP-dependent enzyme [Planctomycetota bacterium]
MIAVAGGVDRLRPHCKTHKMPEVTRIELARGITKHKCATIAEAEMLADAGVKDIFLAYNIVGANIARVVAFRQRYPDVSFMVTGDHPGPIAQLGAALAAAGTSVGMLLDLDVGQHRTGVPAGPAAVELYQTIAKTPGLWPAGFHVYDGHQHQKSLDERTTAINEEWGRVVALRDQLQGLNLPVPRLVCGGTGSFPVYAKKTEAEIELSPGTCVFHDAGYTETFPDLVFPPAVLILTRVISRPSPDRVTLDLGYKAVASDPPAGRRLTLPDLPEAEHILQNEEHLVVRTVKADQFQPGDELFAIPRHICPTIALHKQVYVVADGKVAGRWDVVARDRWLTL